MAAEQPPRSTARNYNPLLPNAGSGHETSPVVGMEVLEGALLARHQRFL